MDRSSREPEFIRSREDAPDAEAALSAKSRAGAPPRFKRRKPVNSTSSSLALSLLFHASILIVVVGVQLYERFFPDSEAQKALLRAKDFKNAIRVDIVDLPRLKLQEMQNVDLTIDKTSSKPKEAEPAPVLPPKISPKAMVDPNAKKIDLEQDERIKFLRERLRADQKRKDALDRMRKKGGAPSDARAELAGNIKSDGYSTTGDLATDLDVFQGKIQAHLRKFWKVPAWMQSSTLKASVVIKLAPDGRIISKQFVKRSGNEEFDRYVDLTLAEASPLPAPPPVLKVTVLEEGIECAFPK